MGRKATGRTTKLVRIPTDMDLGKVMDLYYAIEVELSKPRGTSPRSYFLNQFLDKIEDVIKE